MTRAAPRVSASRDAAEHAPRLCLAPSAGVKARKLGLRDRARSVRKPVSSNLALISRPVALMVTRRVPRSRELALTSRNRIRQTRPARPVLHARRGGRAVRAIVQATVRAVGWIEALIGRGVAIVGGVVHAAIVPNGRGAQ
jgi:hypothetical protein